MSLPDNYIPANYLKYSPYILTRLIYFKQMKLRRLTFLSYLNRALAEFIAQAEIKDFIHNNRLKVQPDLVTINEENVNAPNAPAGESSNHFSNATPELISIDTKKALGRISSLIGDDYKNIQTKIKEQLKIFDENNNLRQNLLTVFSAIINSFNQVDEQTKLSIANDLALHHDFIDGIDSL